MALGDLIKLLSPTLWTIDSGLRAVLDVCSLYRYEDLFNDGIFDSVNLDKSASGNGYVEELPCLFMESKANADTAYWYDKTPLDLGVAEVFTARLSERNVNSVVWPISIINGADAPAENADARIEIVILIVDTFRVRYPYSGGGSKYWNQATGAWQDGSVSGPDIIDYDHVFEYQLIKTVTGFFVRIKDLNNDTYMIDTTVATEVPWTDILSTGDNYYFLSGDYKTSVSIQTGLVASYWKNYPLTEQIATMGEIDFNGVFTQFPITTIIATGADIVWEYNVDGAGWVQPAAGTPADVLAALDGIYITTLDLRAYMTSDIYGDAFASFDINGGAVGVESVNPQITGGDLFQAVYNRIITFPPTAALLDTRAYPVHLPQDPVYPAVTYYVVGEDPRFSCFGEDATADAAVTYKRLRISCWATDYNDMVTLKEAIRQAFQRYAGINNGVSINECFIDNGQELYEAELGVHHYVMDLRIAYEEV